MMNQIKQYCLVVFVAALSFAGTATTDNHFSFASGATAGSITITTLSATSIKGTYTTKVTNTSVAALSVSRTFKGTF